MKDLTKNLFAKVVAMFILVISFVLGLACVISFSYMLGDGYYDQAESYYETNSFYRIMESNAHNINNMYTSGGTNGEINTRLNLPNSNYTYKIYRIDDDAKSKTLIMEGASIGEIKASERFTFYNDRNLSESQNISTNDIVAIEYDNTEIPQTGNVEIPQDENIEIPQDESIEIPQDENIEIPQDENNVYIEVSDPNNSEHIEVEIMVREISKVTGEYYNDKYYLENQVFENLYPLRYKVIVVGFIAGIVFLANLIFLLCSAGHRKGSDQITLNFQDKIPLDLYLFVMGTAGVAMMALANEGGNYPYAGNVLFFGISFTVSAIIFLAILMTLATRIKAGRFWGNTIAYRIFKFFYKLFLKIISTILEIISNLGIVYKGLLIFCGYVIGLMIFWTIFVSNGGDFIAFVIVGLINIAALIFVYKNIMNLKILRDAGIKMAMGNIDDKVDTTKLIGDYKIHGENLNNISLGMQRAVEQKLKSERFKTELITNVSHDIKTPLTSIINYIDLIRKEKPIGKFDEYSAICEKQAKRLKKLLDDLVEASKASTGNISIELSKTDVCEIINQAVGEYGDRLSASNIETVVTLPNTPTYIMADGKKLWRVIDNVLSNICKYTLLNTRAYIDVIAYEDIVVLAFKNISKERLNISSDELLERFVRGDSSRNTEGSGLGLNIAKSFTELQKGRFDIKIDGDLFKTEITFNKLK